MALVASRPAPAVDSLYGASMGTRWRVCVPARRERDLHRLHDAIQAELDGVDAAMSTWRADSAISRFNHANAGSWIELPANVCQVLDAALQVAAASAGAFDPTVGGLVQAWGFGSNGPQASPNTAGLQQQRQALGWQALDFDAPNRRVRQAGGVQLDLSAIAKGFALDRVLACMLDAGEESALIDVGGEVAGYGRRDDGAAWQVAIESDHLAEEPACRLPLDGLCVATSGDYWHHRDEHGRHLSHSIDPRSGQPVPDAALAVSVVMPSGMLADAWSTAFTVLGVDAGLELARDREFSVRYLVRAADGPAAHCSDAFLRLQRA